MFHVSLSNLYCTALAYPMFV